MNKTKIVALLLVVVLFACHGSLVAAEADFVTRQAVVLDFYGAAKTLDAKGEYMYDEMLLNYEDAEDIDQGTANAFKWACNRGILKGYDDNRLAPEDMVTKEQLVTFLYRYGIIAEMDMQPGKTENLLLYQDYEDISGYAVLPMGWAFDRGIVEGEGGMISPKSTVTHEDFKTIWERFMAEYDRVLTQRVRLVQSPEKAGTYLLQLNNKSVEIPADFVGVAMPELYLNEHDVDGDGRKEIFVYAETDINHRMVLVFNRELEALPVFDAHTFIQDKVVLDETGKECIISAENGIFSYEVSPTDTVNLSMRQSCKFSNDGDLVVSLTVGLSSGRELGTFFVEYQYNGKEFVIENHGFCEALVIENEISDEGFDWKLTGTDINLLDARHELVESDGKKVSRYTLYGVADGNCCFELTYMKDGQLTTAAKSMTYDLTVKEDGNIRINQSFEEMIDTSKILCGLWDIENSGNYFLIEEAKWSCCSPEGFSYEEGSYRLSEDGLCYEFYNRENVLVAKVEVGNHTIFAELYGQMQENFGEYVLCYEVKPVLYVL